MPIFRRALLAPIIALAMLTQILAIAPALAQTDRGAPPENAQARVYGPGWECDYGFARRGETCAAVVLPEHARSTDAAMAGNAYADFAATIALAGLLSCPPEAICLRILAAVAGTATVAISSAQPIVSASLCRNTAS